MAIITIVGSGMMGSALAFPARANGHEVRLVGTHLDRDIIDNCRKCGRHPKFERDFPSGVSYYRIEEFETALEGADAVIGGVSSFGVDWFGDYVLPKIADGTPVLTVTKGLYDTADGYLYTYPELWAGKLRALGKSLPLCAVGGPCTSYELVAEDHSSVSFCGYDIEAVEKFKSLMACDYYHVSTTTDVRGIESAVALKNAYALGVALTVGLNQKKFGIDSPLHFNSQAAIFTEAVREMDMLLRMQDAHSVNNLAVGVGDLYVTVYGGRTRLVGILLGRGLTVDEALNELKGVTLESLVVAERVARAVKVKAARGEVDVKELPLLMHMDAILTEKKPADIPWDSFTYAE